MKKIIGIIALLVIVFAAYWLIFRKKSERGPRQQPLKVSKHSQPFNQCIFNAMHSYFDLQASFINADPNGAKVNAQKFMALLDSVKIDELKKDTTGIYQSALVQIGDIKANADAILLESDLTEMRKDYRMISENLYPFLKTINYEGPKLYWHNCGMPFGENTSANWISETYEINNPYLGKNHPQFKSGMLHCGQVQDSIYPR